MKAKTISAILSHKFNSWMNSITDEKVKNLVKDNTIITGGSIVSLLSNEEVNDFDLYFKNLETTKAVAQYYVDLFKQNPPKRFASGHVVDIAVTVNDNRVRIGVKSAGIVVDGHVDNYRYFEMTPPLDSGMPDVSATEYLNNAMAALDRAKNTEKGQYRPIALSSNAITLSDKIQLIIRFYGNPEEIHHNFDFVHCTNYWDSATKELTLNPKALECLLTKELLYAGSLYPLCSIIRTRKFIARGWTINAGQYLKMVMQLQDLDLKNFAVLQDQLTGVDSAYFHELISKLQEKDPSAVNVIYLIELIDKIF